MPDEPLLAAVLSAVDEHLKESVLGADVLIFFDPDNISKCFPFRSSTLFKASSVLKGICSADDSVVGSDKPEDSELSSSADAQPHADRISCVSPSPRSILVLSSREPKTINNSSSSTSPLRCQFKGPSLCNVTARWSEINAALVDGPVRKDVDSVEAIASLSSLLRCETSVPPRSLQGDHNNFAREQTSGLDGATPNVLSTSYGCSIPDKDRWSRAYNSFFRMILGQSIKNCSAMSTLRLDMIVQIAEHYGAVLAIERSFNRLLLAWADQAQLWTLVANAPSQWLRIGFIMRCREVYEEALKHIVGAHQQSHMELVRSTLPPIISKIIQEKTQDLEKKWDAFKSKLQLLKPDYAGLHRNVSNSSQCIFETVQYQVYSCWRAWLVEHLSLLDQFDGTFVTAAGTILCQHREDCLNYAGFVRVLRAGNDKYMLQNDVKRSLTRKQSSQGSLRQVLTRLKQRVARLAESMASTLALDARSRADLTYLTCIEISTKDIPWLSDEDVEMPDVASETDNDDDDEDNSDDDESSTLPSGRSSIADGADSGLENSQATGSSEDGGSCQGKGDDDAEDEEE